MFLCIYIFRDTLYLICPWKPSWRSLSFVIYPNFTYVSGWLLIDMQSIMEAYENY